MKLRFLIMAMVALTACMASQAKRLFPDSDTASNEVELGVEGISRLCPTGLWDHGTFRDILFDKESNSVVFVIQLYNWNARHEAKVITEAEAKKDTESIVQNIMEAYDDFIKNPRIEGDGDFMLYLSLGTLLKQMEKDGVNLRIALLKPDYENLVGKGIPFEMSPAEIREILK